MKMKISIKDNDGDWYAIDADQEILFDELQDAAEKEGIYDDFVDAFEEQKTNGNPPTNFYGRKDVENLMERHARLLAFVEGAAAGDFDATCRKYAQAVIAADKGVEG